VFAAAALIQNPTPLARIIDARDELARKDYSGFLVLMVIYREQTMESDQTFKLKVTRWHCFCVLCDYKWLTVTEKAPKVCSGCNSPNWNGLRRQRRLRADKGKPRPITKRPKWNLTSNLDLIIYIRFRNNFAFVPPSKSLF